MHIVKKISFTAKEGKTEELHSLLNFMVKESSKENGCDKYELYQFKEDKNQFFLIEVWIDKESLDAHKNTGHYRKFKEEIDSLAESKKAIDLNYIY
jgi:quinol monooxygenase YgiN